MNKIFKVIWCSSSQVWVAVSELSKVKPVSSVSSVKKTSSAVSTLLKTTALAIPFALSPLAAHAYVAIGSTYVDGAGNTYYYAAGADANPAGTYSAAGTKPLDYFNPGNKSYDDKTRSSGATDENGEPILIDRSRMASPIAIGYGSNAKSYDGRAGVALGDYANASDGLGVAIGSYARSDKVGATAIGTASRAGGINSLAMMRQAAANGNYSVAIGSVSWAQGESSFAMGASATAKGDQSIAIGNVLQQSASASGTTKTKYNGLENTQSNGVRSVAIGSGAKTNGDDSFAFGSAASTGKFKVERDAYLKDRVANPDAAGAADKAIAFGSQAGAAGESSIAFGYLAQADKKNSIAFGVESQSLDKDAIAFGSGAKANKVNSTAFGSNANASEANAIAFGSNAQALHENVITIGKDSKATKKGAMTIGEGAQSNANNSLALGNGTIINQEDLKNKNAKYTNDGFEIENGVVAIANKGKERRLVNLAAGREDTDAVNVKQLSEVNDNLAKSIAGPTYNGYTVDGNGRYTYKAPDFEIKNQTLHNVKEAVELAQTNYVSVKSTIDPKTAGSNYDNKGAQGAGSIALGESTGTNAAAVDSVAIGHNTKVNGNNTVAIGANITAATNGSVILGDSSKADGSHATKTVASKEIDGHTYNFAGKAKDAGRFVSVGEKGNERQIKNVAAGHVEDDSTDAINGSQLYAVASRVEQGWKITAAKTGTGEVSGNAEKKVAMGDTVTFTAGDNIKITQNEKNLTVATKENVTFTNVTTGNTSLDDKGLTIKNGPSVTKDGVNAGNKKITNVSNGTISADSKDAVNGSQLHATNQNVTNNANNIANNAQNITKNAQNITKNAENIAKGLNFKGDNADVTVNRQLGETLNVTGGADKNNLSDNNIGVIGESNPSAATGGLAIKLAKDLKGLNSVETKQIKLGDNSSNTTIKYEGDRIKYGDKTVANLDDEKHITNTTYAVGNDGNVSLTYTDGKGNVVNGMTATITGVAKNDLSNINNDGKKVITGLGTIVEAADSSVTVTNTTDAVGRTTYKVKANVPGADAFNIKYKANGANEQTVTLNKGLDFTDGNFTTASVAENGVVKYDVKTGNITNGVDGKTGVNGNDGLATVKTVVEAINNSGWLANATKSTGELDGTSTATKVKPGAVVNFDAGKNLTVKQQINGDNHTYTYSLSKDIEVENVVVTGKDGKDGKIGLNGKDGTNGKNGTNRVDIQVEKGVDGVEGKNGADGISRVVYEDGKGKHTVATMEDGLKFKGDDSTVIAKKLNEQLDIIGGANKTDLTDNNIGVNHDNGKLKVQLAKNLNLTDTGSIKFGDNNLNINKDGLTITNGPSVTKDGINAGNKAITNVTAGTNATDAVNVSQLNAVKAAERHIKPGEYAVDNSGNVTMTYLDGNGQDVTNEKAVITGVAKNDLSNITNDGKKVITGLGTVVKQGDNVTVTEETDSTTGQTTYTVSTSKQNLGDAELAYKSNGDATTKKTVKVSDGLDFTNGNFTTASVDENGVVKYDVNVGEIENGANGKDGKPGVKGDNGLATVKTVVEAINNSGWLANATKSTGEIEGTSTATKVKPGAVVNFDAGKNLKVKQTLNGDDHTYTYSLDSNLTNLDKVVVNGKDGANGKDGVTITGPNGAKGEDGKVGITGKDGKDAVSIAGKDGVGHIGLTGPKGADGSDGKSIDISTKDGTQTLVNQEPGTDKSQRIVYTPKDKDGNPIKGKDGKDIVREVATMDDGLKFAGDDGQTDDSKVIAKKLNQKVDIVGGADKTKLTENNIGVNNKDGKLNVQLSKDINLTDAGSIKFGDDLTINNNGLTIKDGPSITKTGIDGGNKQIKNVAEGTEDNDAVTVKQLKDSKTALVNGKNTTVTGTGTSADPYKVNVEGALTDITSITNKDGNGKVEFAADQVVNVAGDNPIKLDAKTGDITGLTNKTIDGSDFATKGRAATEEQLKATGDQITNNLTKKGLNFGAQSGEVIHKNLGDQLDIVGEGTKADDRYDATNIKTMTKNGKVVVGLAKDVNLTQDGSVTIGDTALNNGGLTITGGPSVTTGGINAGDKQITNVDSGLKKADGSKVELKDAQGDTLKNAVNVGDLKDTISNITNNGFGLTDENGKDVKAKLGETVTVKGDGSVTTKVITDKDGKAKLQVGLNKDVTIGNNEEPGTITVKGENGKDGISINGKDGTIGLKGEDGKDGIALNGKDGTIGINGKDGSNGKITVAQGKAGLDGNDGADGETKTRIVYEKPNGDKEEVATLNDGLKFTGNNEVENSHKLNSLVTIKGEGVDKAASEKFESAAGNVNVKAYGKGTLEVQLAKDLKNIDSISNKDGQKIEFKDGGTTISGGNVSVDGNKITDVKAGEDDTDAVNVKQLKDGIAQATTKVAAGKNVNVTSDKNPDGSTTYTVATKDDVDFTSVTTGKTTMNDGGITIKATEGGKTNVTLTNKGLDNGGNKVVNVAEGTNDTDAVNVKQLKAAKTEVEAGDNVVVTSTKGSNGQTIYKVNATDNSAHVDGSDAVTVTKAPTTRKNGTTTVTDYKVDLSNKTKDDINKGVDAHDTVNNKGLTFNADKGTTGVKKLGSQVAVNGDNKNIETVADANGVKVKLKDDISVNTVTAKTIKAGDTTINDNGLTINNGPSVTKDGINAGGSRITNVAPGRDGTDAVNVNQLKKATNEIHNSLNKMDKRRKAGTASALATAGLMQAYREGQSSVTAGVGQYQNQSAVAVGYSRLSDNGKYGVKVSFTTNTQGEVGGTASAGYFW